MLVVFIVSIWLSMELFWMDKKWLKIGFFVGEWCIFESEVLNLLD